MTPLITRIFFTAFLVIFISVAPAHAVEINDEGAARLKSMLTQQMEDKKSALQQNGGDVTTEGEITIEQGDGYYAATMPATTYKINTDENIKIGLVAINAIPTDNPDDWKMSVAIPTPILITGANDETIKRINIGSQKMGGLWSSSLKGFSKLSAQYNNLKFTDVAKNDGFTIDKIIIKSDLEENKKDLWDGATNIAISNFSAASPTIQNLFSVKEIMVVINVNGYSPEIKNITNDGKSKGGTILAMLKSSGDISAQFNLKNIEINDQNAKNNVKAIKLIQFGYNSDTPNDGKINQGLNFGYSGVKFKETAPSNNLIPEQFKTSISLKNFPLVDFIDFAQETIGDNKVQSAKQVATMKALSFLPEKLKNAGTTLLLKNTNFSNNIYDVKINGEMKADPASQIGGIGNLNIETTGLNAIMKELETIPNGSAIAQQLTMFRLISEQKGNKNIAKIELNKEGNITVNGKDMSALMGGGGKKEPASQSK